MAVIRAHSGQNETIGDQHVINLDWSKKLRAPLRGNQFQVVLYKCDRASPPRRKDNDVRVEGVINCRINTPFEQLPQFVNPQGDIWRSVEFQVEMKPTGTMLEFVVIYNGSRQQPLKINPPFTAAAGEIAQPPPPSYSPRPSPRRGAPPPPPPASPPAQPMNPPPQPPNSPYDRIAQSFAIRPRPSSTPHLPRR